jgi:hypothetical protein
VILATASLFVPIHIEHPLAMLAFLVLISATFCLFGFIIGIVSNNFEQMQVVPMLVVTPLTFLGGAFYSITMLPPAWQTVAYFNPVVYLISGFRWTFFGQGDVPVVTAGDGVNHTFTITVTNTVAAATPYSESIGAITLNSGRLNITSTNANTGGTQLLQLSGLTQAQRWCSLSVNFRSRSWELVCFHSIARLQGSSPFAAWEQQ